MIRASRLVGLPVHRELRARQRARRRGFLCMRRSLGTVANVVCRPDGQAVCGFMIRRPDFIMMAKRRDVFAPLDAIRLVDDSEDSIFVAGHEGAFRAAPHSCELDWNRCIFALGLPVRTENGIELGRVRDLIFDLVSGVIDAICIADGIAGRVCVGEIAIPTTQVVTYRPGAMIVCDDVAEATSSGGFAAWAGSQYAEAKILGKRAVQSFKNSAQAERRGSSPSTHDGPARENWTVARAAGEKLARTRGMFSAFKKEFEKNSK